VKKQRKLEAELGRESPKACCLTLNDVAEFIMVLKGFSWYSTQIVHKIAAFTQVQSTRQNLRVPKSCTFEQLNV
jgi:hypothetical protein